MTLAGWMEWLEAIVRLRETELSGLGSMCSVWAVLSWFRGRVSDHQLLGLWVGVERLLSGDSRIEWLLRFLLV